jgi:hypothetical protein
LSKGQRGQLLFNFQDVVLQGPSDIGGVTEVQCQIPTEDGKTVKFVSQPLPPHLKKNLKEQLDALVTKGVVEKASSACPFSSPLVPRQKEKLTNQMGSGLSCLKEYQSKGPSTISKLSTLKSIKLFKKWQLTCL